MSRVVTVTLGTRKMALEQPTDLAAVVDCIRLAKRNATRAGYMAIALCWPMAEPGRPKTSYADTEYDSGRFGGLVLDELVAAKVPMRDIIFAGAQALGVVARALPSKAEVVAAEGFSGGQEES